MGDLGNVSKTGTLSFTPTYSNATNQITSVGGQNYSYDANGNLLSTGTGLGTNTYTWNSYGAMTGDTPNGSPSSAVTVLYDALGRPAFWYTGSTCTGTTCTTAVYGPDGSKLALMNGQTLSRARIAAPGGGLDLYGPSATLVRYWHSDWQGSMRLVTNPTRTFYSSTAWGYQFGYDRYANLSSMTVTQGSAPGLNVSVSGTTNRVSGSPYGYDLAGNMTNDSFNSFGFDAEGRMISWSGSGGSGTTTYNALDEAVQFSNAGGGGAQPFDLNGQLLGLYTFSDSSWTDFYVYMGARQIAWLAQVNEAFTHFPHTNSLGSTTQVTDQSGNLTYDVLWYPYGDQWTNSGSWGDTIFSGMWPCPGCPEYITPNRRYVPELGRWLVPDRLAGDISNPQSLNRYAYVMNNPTSFLDPRGTCPQAPSGQAYTPDCKHLHPVSCTTMDCADQYYGGTIFLGWSGIGQSICFMNGKAGACFSDPYENAAFGTNGNDIFDALAGAPGTYLTQGLTTNGNGQVALGMMGFGFDDQLWSQTWGFIEAEAGAPTMGYVQYQTWDPIQRATSSPPGDNVRKAGFINSLYTTIDAVALSNAQGKPILGPYVDVTAGNIAVTTYSLSWIYTPLGPIPVASPSVSNWPFP